MYASTPQGEALLLDYQHNPYMWLFERPDATQDLNEAQDMPQTSVPSYADGGTVQGVPEQSQNGMTVQQMVQAGLLPPSVLQGQNGEANGMQQAANAASSAPLGLNPGRQAWPSIVGSLLGKVMPGAGVFMSLGNAANGAIAGEQQLAAMRGLTGVNNGGVIGAGLSGATGIGGFSSYSRGLGGYGQPGQGGLVGMRDALDPGVDGVARAMNADAADAVARAASNPSSDNPAGLGAAASAAAAHAYADNSNPGSLGGGDFGSLGNQTGGGQGVTGGEMGYAIGGVVRNVSGDYFSRKMARGSGLIKAISPGRADGVHATVPRGGYVVPADVVSGIGQGNTIAGGRMLSGMVKRVGSVKGPMKPDRVPVRLSGGEFFIHPHHLAAIGGGNPARGAAVMDGVVNRVRAMSARHALGAIGPR